MLQMEHCEVIWACCCSKAGIFYGLPDMVCREEADIVVQRVITQELASYATCLIFGYVPNHFCKLLTESTGYFMLVRNFLVVESDCLISAEKSP